MFFILILATVLGGNTYVFYRLWNMVPQGSPLRWILLAFGVAAVASFFVSMLAGGTLPLGVTEALYRLGTAWFFIMLFFLMLFLAADIARLCGAPLRQYMYASWTGFFVSVGFVAVIMTAGNIVYHNKKRVELTLQVNKALPAHGLKIVAVSDMHLGYGIGKRELARWVKMINAEKPDIVLIAGDVIDNSTRPLVERNFAPVLRKLEAPYGVYAAPGNHEYISGLEPSLAFLAEAGVNVLRDSAALIDGTFYVVGRDDRANPHRKPLGELVDGLDRTKPVIVLDHQPYELEQAGLNGVDLQLSGHTHRGQIWPVSWVTDMLYEKSHGYLRKEGSHIYVSSGIGLWGGKFRIGTRSEYVVITLRSR